MSILDVEFEWPVAAAGYQAIDYGPRPGPQPIEQSETYRLIALAAGFEPRPAPPTARAAGPWGVQIVARNPEARRVTPLALNRELYLRFAELDDRPDAFADFATRWGLLTTWGTDSQAEPAEVWSYHLKLAKSALALTETDPKALADFDPDPDQRGRRVEPNLTARLVWDGRLSLRITPRSLLHGLWLQFFQSVSRGTDIKSCDRCGRWFERGLGTERGRKARFCSDTCRFGFHNDRRIKGRPA